MRWHSHTHQAHTEDRGGVKLTFSEAVPRVDVPVINIHDVYTPVTHEVSLMAIALWADATVTEGSWSQEGDLQPLQELPPALCGRLDLRDLVLDSRAGHIPDTTQQLPLEPAGYPALCLTLPVKQGRIWPCYPLGSAGVLADTESKL